MVYSMLNRFASNFMMLIGLLLFLFPSIKSDNRGSIASNAIPKHDPCSSMGSGHKWQKRHTLEYCLCFFFSSHF